MVKYVVYKSHHGGVYGYNEERSEEDLRCSCGRSDTLICVAHSIPEAISLTNEFFAKQGMTDLGWVREDIMYCFDVSLKNETI